MSKNKLEKFELKTGFEVDINEGWKKIISRQFGGDPERGFGELIQNLIDSYSSSIPFEERKGIINSKNNTISITDYGSGLDRKKLKLLTTLGGTDKSLNNDKIGTFGMGFFSIFNPRLETKEVKLITKCEDQIVQLIFKVTKPEETPELLCDILEMDIDFSTRIEVKFNNFLSVKRCVKAAKKALKYYPCKILINNQIFMSIWEEAKKNGSYIFSSDLFQGFITKQRFSNVEVMCKYEHIITLWTNSFLTGGRSMKNNLDDFADNNFPFIPNISFYINCNNINVTISRDSFYLNYSWTLLKQEIAKLMLDYLDDFLSSDIQNENIIANQYIFKNDIKSYLNSEKKEGFHPAIIKLAKANIFKLDKEKTNVSLEYIKNNLDDDLPLFFAERRENIYWLGGNFKNDFIVLPEYFSNTNRIIRFYEKLFTGIFDDVINLDTILSNNKKIKNLIERKIINKKDLSPKCKIVGEKHLEKHEDYFLRKMQILLESNKIRECIESHLHIPIKTIKPVFMTIESENAFISTGILNTKGKPLDDEYISNFLTDKKVGKKVEPINLLLGLSLNHPFIQNIVEARHPYREYFSLTYAAHELSLSQKLLVPYSPFFNLVKEKLAGSMRNALMEELLDRNDINLDT